MFAARRVAAALAFCVILHTGAFAQVTTADIVGRVTDASGAILPGVTVTVENIGTHETRVRVDGGLCRMASRPPDLDRLRGRAEEVFRLWSRGRAQPDGV